MASHHTSQHHWSAIRRKPIADFEHRRARAFEQFSREVALRVEDPRLSDKTHWNGVVARTRVSLRASDEEALILVRELRDLRRPLNDMFREIYTLTDPYVRPPIMAGNCPVTRHRGTASIESSDPDLTVATQTNCLLSDAATTRAQRMFGRGWPFLGRKRIDAEGRQTAAQMA